MMEPYAHGGDVYSEKITYDFSANINPFGMPASVKKVLREQVDLYANYPDPQCRELKCALAEHEGVPTSHIVCGNGASELLYQVIEKKQPKRVLLPVPSFVEYEKAVLEAGAEILYYRRKPETGFKLGEDLLTFLSGAEHVGDTKNLPVDMVILCNPNNPDGALISPAFMVRILNCCECAGITLVVDECFLDFTGQYYSHRVQPEQKNVIILKAFTKIYAMAGLRLGYVLCADTVFNEELAQMGQCWNVSVPAQLAGVAALGEQMYVTQTRSLIETERLWLSGHLRELGFRVFPSAANFILFYSEIELSDALRKFGIGIRDCANYHGLGEGYYRIAVRTHEENKILIDTIEHILMRQGER